MIDGSKVTAKCSNVKCNNVWVIRLGAPVTPTCQVCGCQIVTLMPQVITKGLETPPKATPMPDDGEPVYSTTNPKEPKKRGRKPGRK